MLYRYRLDMINWSTKIRHQDYTYFCKAAINKYEAERSSSSIFVLKIKPVLCSVLLCGS